MLRRLHPEQPDSFAFTPGNQTWAEQQITKFPEGRQASAVIPLLWRAQEQEGWVTRPAIESIAQMLNLAPIRVLEVASFYFMFQLQPVGSVAHVQVCGTTSCMICGAEDLVAVCRAKIAPNPHDLSPDGKFSWEEVECLGACSNAPMAQIGKDYYEDLTSKKLGELIDALARGEVPTPGPQNGRFAAEPFSGLTSLKEGDRRYGGNASVSLAEFGGDTIKRIDGDEPALRMEMLKDGARPNPETSTDQGASADPEQAVDDRRNNSSEPKSDAEKAKMEAASEADKKKVVGAGESKEDVTDVGKLDDDGPAEGDGSTPASQPETLTAPRNGQADDLKRINGIGPVLEGRLNELGFFHFDQIAGWTEAELAWIDEHMVDFKGRAARDEWVEQASTLATENDD